MIAEEAAAREALARLRQWGGEPLVRSMAALFVEETAARLALLRDAVAADDRAAAAGAAHSLRASCGQMGAGVAESLCREIEGSLAGADPAAPAALVARLDDACARYLAWLDRELAAPTPA